MEELEFGVCEARSPVRVHETITDGVRVWGLACGENTVPLEGVLNEAGDPVPRTDLRQRKGAVGEGGGATLHDGVGSPACVVVPVMSDPIQEGPFEVLDDVGKTRESVPNRGCKLEERFML